MTDEKLEMVKKYFEKFESLEQFKKEYLDTNKPANEKALIDCFYAAKSNSDGWEIYKYQASSESLRMDKLIESKSVKTIIEKLQNINLSKYKRIIIKLDNIDYPNIESLKRFGKDIYVNVTNDKGLCTLDEFINMRKFFNYFKHQFSSYQLSPIEKITIAYDYVKFFAYNPEITDRLTDSRSIAKSISSGYIVCESYSNIFCQLLQELDIDSYLVYTDKNGRIPGGHVRNIVDIYDEKYRISGKYVFDPTWDSSMDMCLVKREDGELAYKLSSKIKNTETILEKLPSDVRYLFFMVPLTEYSKYFPGDYIDKIKSYSDQKVVPQSDALNETLYYDDGYPRDDDALDLLPLLLKKTKKIEGYSEEQIKVFLNHVVALLEQYRFGILDKHKNMGVRK